jgi:hypothetical protein
MSNSEPSAIVLHGIPCIGGLYISFDSNGEIGSCFLVHRRGLVVVIAGLASSQILSSGTVSLPVVSKWI